MKTKFTKKYEEQEKSEIEAKSEKQRSYAKDVRREFFESIVEAQEQQVEFLEQYNLEDPEDWEKEDIAKYRKNIERYEKAKKVWMNKFKRADNIIPKQGNDTHRLLKLAKAKNGGDLL